MGRFEEVTLLLEMMGGAASSWRGWRKGCRYLGSRGQLNQEFSLSEASVIEHVEACACSLGSRRDPQSRSHPHTPVCPRKMAI